MKKKGSAFKSPKVFKKSSKRKITKRWGYIPKARRFCAICKTDRKLEVHHIIPQSKSGTNHANNLMVLCTTHHMNIHHPSQFTDIKKKYKKLLKGKFNKIRTP